MFDCSGIPFTKAWNTSNSRFLKIVYSYRVWTHGHIQRRHHHREMIIRLPARAFHNSTSFFFFFLLPFLSNSFIHSREPRGRIIITFKSLERTQHALPNCPGYCVYTAVMPRVYAWVSRWIGIFFFLCLASRWLMWLKANPVFNCIHFSTKN